jgi:parallel beta-helix repeat protein
MEMLTRRTRTTVLLGTTCAALATGGGIAVVAPADAAACAGQWQLTSANVLYLNSGDVDLPELLTTCPGTLALTEVDSATHTWQLNATLVVRNGATLRVRGAGKAKSEALQVNTLLLRSRSSNLVREVSSITAQSGNLDFDSTKVTSWDDQKNAPDTTTTLGSGQAAPAYIARPFVRAVSMSAAAESKLDIVDSDFGYLGWYNAESYGVAYKVRGCDAAHTSVCDTVKVGGSQLNSKFHHNYMGTYTFGAKNMTFDGNEYANNVMYGLDPHDDSDYLTITNNTMHDNGDHGLICSQRCNNLTITGNESYRNGIPPFAFPDDEDLSDNQIHGIMIHRGVTQSVIKDNYVHDNINGAGLAIFDSSDDVFEDNIIKNNKYGIRLSVGSQNMVFKNNVVSANLANAVYTYVGSDAPTYGNLSGRSKNLQFIGNTFDGSVGEVVKLQHADNVTFKDTVVTGKVGKVTGTSVTALAWDGDGLPGTGEALKTSSTGTLKLPPTGSTTSVQLDSSSKLSLLGPDSRLGQISGKTIQSTVAASGGSTMALTSSLIGTSAVTVTPRPLTVKPSTGSLQAAISSWSTSKWEFTTDKGTKNSTVAITLGGLTKSKKYKVKQDGTTTTLTADSSGAISWSFKDTSGSKHTSSVAPA